MAKDLIRIKNMPNLNIKLRLYLTKEQSNILDGHSRICNWLYNNLLEKANNFKKEFKEKITNLELKKETDKISKILYSKYGLRNLVPEIKKEHKFLNVVYSSCLKNTALRLTQTIKDYQSSKKGKRKGEITGWPKFRKWSLKWFSLYYEEPFVGYKINHNILKLSLGMGLNKKRKSLNLKIEKYNFKDKKVKTLRIMKQHNQYYAVFTIEKELPETKPVTKYLSLDPNHENLSWGVDNFGNSIRIEYPRHLKSFDEKIDEVKSKRDKCVKKLHKRYTNEKKSYYLPSRRWQKLDDTLKKMYAKRQEQTKHFLYTLANNLCSKYDYITIGNYTPKGGGINKGMRRSMNNQSLIGRFKKVLSWVAYKSGKQYLEYNEYNTTKECSYCNTLNEKSIPPTIRKWQCISCNKELLRDENSAINGFKKSFHDIFMRCSRLFSNMKRCAWRVSHGLVFTHPLTI